MKLRWKEKATKAYAVSYMYRKDKFFYTSLGFVYTHSKKDAEDRTYRHIRNTEPEVPPINITIIVEEVDLEMIGLRVENE